MPALVVNGENIGYGDVCSDYGEWDSRSSGGPRENILKAEIKLKGVSYRELGERLTTNGIPETEPNLANKIARGTFTAALFIQCLEAIGAS